MENTNKFPGTPGVKRMKLDGGDAKSRLEEKVAQLEAKLAQMGGLQETIDTLTIRGELREKKIKMKNEQIALLERDLRRLSEAQHELSDPIAHNNELALENQRLRDQLTLKESISPAQHTLDQLTLMLENKICRLTAAEKECAVLRIANTELASKLEESVVDYDKFLELQRKVALLNELVEENLALKAKLQIEHSKDTLLVMQRLMKDANDALAAEKRKTSQVQKSKAELESICKAHEAEIALLRSNVSSLTEKNNAFLAETDQLTQENLQLAAKYKLQEMEKNSLLKLLESYENENKMMFSTLTPQENRQSLDTHLLEEKDKIAERLLGRIQVLEAELEQFHQGMRSPPPVSFPKKQQSSSADEDDFIIIHMKQNPISQLRYKAVKAYLNPARESNIACVFSSRPNDENPGKQPMEEPDWAKEKLDLNDKIKNLTLQKQRQCEVFDIKIKELKSFIYQALGYTIDIKIDTYSLRSAFCATNDDWIHFKMKRNQISIVKSAYSKYLSSKLDLRNPPEFLAQLTVLNITSK